MIHLYWGIAGLFALWLETGFSSYLQIAGFKINTVLIVLLILMLRWKSPFLLFYGLTLGLMSDAVSHSMIGVYGLSFFLILILTRWIGVWFYDKNLISTALFVAALSWLEGGVALTLFKLVNSDLSWNRFFFQTVSFVAIIQGLISPLFLVILIRMERILHLKPEEKPSIPFRW